MHENKIKNDLITFIIKFNIFIFIFKICDIFYFFFDFKKKNIVLKTIINNKSNINRKY